ncbi:lasso peptide biosynthesis PqqD family chaperone [Streptomyces marispadix]|uniref:Lasso peptide biosynthesis PqqD family chaperone n=1 Tax=Streptomyces marispadix TaxID=2922868 RepID=A0ABS9SXP5_9ACTN|nr:lasso peptide biosynthesis PqqD family chaperone [Streptomyces marispadix]MCH6161042.1 lasso peptide biosynthesis PqqD family chaperone [Streptomyces marispadix]
MTLRLHPKVAATTTDSGMVLLDQNAGRYFELNATGATVVRALTDGADPVQQLMQRASVPKDQAAQDVAEFLETLRSRGLAVDQ